MLVIRIVVYRQSAYNVSMPAPRVYWEVFYYVLSTMQMEMRDGEAFLLILLIY